MTLTHSYRRPWTFMVYMAGDNGRVFETNMGRLKLMAEMTTAGYHDLAEMGVVGTTEELAVICLFDSLDGSFMIEVQRGQGFPDSIVEEMPDVNSGDPAALPRFHHLQHAEVPIGARGACYLESRHRLARRGSLCRCARSQ